MFQHFKVFPGCVYEQCDFNLCPIDLGCFDVTLLIMVVININYSLHCYNLFNYFYVSLIMFGLKLFLVIILVYFYIPIYWP